VRVSSRRDAAPGLVIVRRLRLGLDCWPSNPALLVGHHLPELAAHCDWIKIMTHARAYGSASVRYEIPGLANWLRPIDGEGESQPMACLADAPSWALPASREAAATVNCLPAFSSQEPAEGALHTNVNEWRASIRWRYPALSDST
jgi:hypothetical protein